MKTNRRMLAATAAIIVMLVGSVNAQERVMRDGDIEMSDKDIYINFIAIEGERYMDVYTVKRTKVLPTDEIGYSLLSSNLQSNWEGTTGYFINKKIPLAFALDEEDTKFIKDGGLKYIFIGNKYYFIDDDTNADLIKKANKVF